METLTAAQLADAYVAVAHANHYMVGIVATVTTTDRDAAEQILISRQNAENRGNENYRRLVLALDLLEQDRRMAGDAP